MEQKGIVKTPNQIQEDHLCQCIDCGKEVKFKDTKWIPRCDDKRDKNNTPYHVIVAVEPYCEDCFEAFTDVD